MQLRQRLESKCTLFCTKSETAYHIKWCVNYVPVAKIGIRPMSLTSRPPLNEHSDPMIAKGMLVRPIMEIPRAQVIHD